MWFLVGFFVNRYRYRYMYMSTPRAVPPAYDYNEKRKHLGGWDCGSNLRHLGAGIAVPHPRLTARSPNGGSDRANCVPKKNKNKP